LAELGWRAAGGFDPVRFAQAVVQHRPESLTLVPELLLALVCVGEAGFELPDSLRFVAVGGARVSPHLLERAVRLGLPVFEGYGLSECSSVVTLNRPGASRTGSTGRPLPHAGVRIADDGEVFVSGVALQGYAGEPTISTSEYATGDLGYLDEDGFLYIRGRKRNVFITSLGRNVSPEWLEAELVQSLEIAQATVYGEARPWIAAVLVPRARDLDCERLRAAVHEVNQRLPDHARVRGWLLADEPFALENGLATANGRCQHDAIYRHYESRIEALYRDRVHIPQGSREDQTQEESR
jgi:long-subunit acyl-CoA synthetase (AMP-forming)